MGRGNRGGTMGRMSLVSESRQLGGTMGENELGHC